MSHFDPNAPKPPSNAHEIPLFEVVKIETIAPEVIEVNDEEAETDEIKEP